MSVMDTIACLQHQRGKYRQALRDFQNELKDLIIRVDALLDADKPVSCDDDDRADSDPKASR
jgi:hypothetical protein